MATAVLSRMVARGAVFGLLLAGVLIVAGSAPAQAMCARGHESPYAFKGTVIATDHQGRVATVVTEDGTRVTVLGGDPAVLSSLDRRYAVGAFYEFHPTNSASPYRANGCTATEKLWGPKPPDFTSYDRGFWGFLAGGEEVDAAGYGLLLATIAGGAVVIAREVRRHRS